MVLVASAELGAVQRASSEDLFDAVLVRPVSTGGFVRALSINPSNRLSADSIAGTPPRPSAGPLAEKIRALVAEVNHTNQMVIKALLEKAGVRADLVVNGLEAVSAMRERPYDLILMDVMMPELDGVSATRLIRSLPGGPGRVRIVGLTANTSLDDHAAFVAAGMDMVLTKPVRYRQLVEIPPEGGWLAVRRGQSGR